jgi:ribosome biogenesis protein Nip4
MNNHSLNPLFLNTTYDQFDTVNKQALRLKCKSLISLGRHSLARNTYEKFSKEYRHVYGEDFPESFREIIHEKIN